MPLCMGVLHRKGPRLNAKPGTAKFLQGSRDAADSSPAWRKREVVGLATRPSPRAGVIRNNAPSTGAKDWEPRAGTGGGTYLCSRPAAMVASIPMNDHQQQLIWMSNQNGPIALWSASCTANQNPVSAPGYPPKIHLTFPSLISAWVKKSSPPQP